MDNPLFHEITLFNNLISIWIGKNENAILSNDTKV